jgi:hypothetical protein
MQFLLNHPWLLGLVSAFFWAGMIEAGRHTSGRFNILEDTHRKDQMVALRDGLFVLAGLLFGFTLALAAARFAERRSLLIEEANAIRVSYLRVETVAEPSREQARQLLRQYIDAQLDYDGAALDSARAEEAANRTKQIQERLWAGVVEITKIDRSAVSAAYMNSLNEVINLHEKRVSSLENRIPISIWLLIFCVSTIAIFSRGLTLGHRFWMTVVLAPLTLAIVITLIADVDSPSSGLIRLDQRAMLRLKADMKSKQQ